MSSNGADFISGTLTLVVVSFDISSETDQRELTLEDIARLLNECLANNGEALVEYESTQERETLPAARVLH